MDKIGNFQLVCSLKCMELIDVEKYESSATGLKVVIGHVPGPIVSAHFALATEAFDDDGLPHTLEHLIFLGSEDYPYKGVLDLLANRNFASGTNAWTDVDHTCYTVKTAGSEGFLNILPVYIDHILYPVLTDAAFDTEVHHITDKGLDGGVVYCEMQELENSGECLARLEMTRAAYPGVCGYKSETGGLLKNLQESTTNIKVRKYHEDFYRPDNLTLIITGQVDTKEILEALKEVEEKIQRKGALPPFVRPWQSVPPKLTEHVDLEVLYGCDDEDQGMVYIGFRGPDAPREIYKVHSLAMLLRYLSDNSASPLQIEFVQTEHPLASAIDYNMLENSSTLLYLVFRNVPIDKLEEIKPLFVKWLNKTRNAEKSLDMERMAALINKQRLELLLNMENSPHDYIGYAAIGDMLYGETVQDLDNRLNPSVYFDKMLNESEEFWLELIDDYLLNNFWVTVRGKPSIAELERREKEEKDRIEKQIESLGVNGLAEKGKKLKEAMQINDVPPPPEMLTAMPVPDPSRIDFHNIESFNTDSPPPVDRLDITGFPLFLHFDHVASSFVYLMALIDTSTVPQDLRMYLPLFMSAIFESPIYRNGELIDYLLVCNELEKDTIAATGSIGVDAHGLFSCGPFAQTVSIAIEVHPDNYEQGVRWIYELLCSTHFGTNRLAITAAKLVNEVAEFRRKGSKLTTDLSATLNFQNGNNNMYWNNAIRQHKFLSTIGKKLHENNQSVIDDLERLRKILTNPENMAVRIGANMETLPKILSCGLVEPWAKLFPVPSSLSKKPLNVVHDYQLLRDPSEKKSTICGVGAVDSVFLSQTLPSITDPYHPDLPALIIFLNYLTQLEGPMWKLIRGQGLAYGFDMKQGLYSGLLNLVLYQAGDVILAYEKTQEIVETHLKPEFEFDPILMVSAKSSAIYNVIKCEETVSSVLQKSLLSYLRGTDANYSREFVKKLAAVEAHEMKRAGQIYVTKLFDPQEVRLSLVCHKSKSEDVGDFFKKTGFNVTVSNSLSEVFLESSAKV